MIDDLDRSLEVLLRRELPPGLMGQVTISFAMPDDQFPPSSVSLPAIDLFLYDIRENRELRTNEWQIERNNGTAIKKRAPARVDCSYLITAWASDTSTTPALDEHLLLGEVMRALLRHPSIPDEVLQGRLQGQDPPLPAAALLPDHLQSLGEFWQALGGKPKAAFHYTVTISVEVQEPVQAGLVTDARFRLQQGGTEE
jgi:hypothetical protein